MTSPIRPEDVLPDGVETATVGGREVRKGTVAAFVANAKRLETLSPNHPDYPAVRQQLQDLVPALQAVGVLDVFTPRSFTIAALVDEANNHEPQA